MNLFETVKQNVSNQEAAELYGVDVSRAEVVQLARVLGYKLVWERRTEDESTIRYSLLRQVQRA